MKKILALMLAVMMMLGCVVIAEEAAALTFHQVQYACHGTKCFAVVSVVMQGDKVVLAHIDEYQVMAKGEGETATVGVPNSDAMFAAEAAEGKHLVSKRANDAVYSANMVKAGSTQNLAVSYDAIQAFCAGKTIAELEAAAGLDNVVDAVSGSTLADTKGYLMGVIEAAKSAPVATGAAAENVEFGQVQFACHGTKCFAIVSVVTAGDKVMLAHIDEYQVMAKGEGETATVGVPNSDAMFAAAAAEGKHLVSKRVNDAVYSANMVKAGSTQNLAVSYDAIQAFCAGKTIAELEAAAGLDNVVDAVSGSTLADTKGYLMGVIEAAK